MTSQTLQQRAAACAAGDWHFALRTFGEVAERGDIVHARTLGDLERTRPGAARLLRKLLDANRRMESHDLLRTLPRSPPLNALTATARAGQRVGPFELVERVGRGGMGEVWRARAADGSLKREVALKLPLVARDAQTLAAMRMRLSRERDILAQLEHPHIARLYDAGFTSDGAPFLAMEFVAGQSIDVYCSEKELPIEARLGLFLQLLGAVGFAHQHLVLHRDIKPSNIWVDERAQVRLLDFGLAKLLDDATQSDQGSNEVELTQAQGVMLTVAFAAPEQINRASLSTASDVYALGVVLYRLLTGLLPYEPSHDSRAALEHCVLREEPAQMSRRTYAAGHLREIGESADSLAKRLRGDLDTIVAKALKKSPAQRYATVSALASDLQRWQARLPIEARPDSWTYRASRFVARNQWAVAASALGAMALAGVATVAAWQAHAAAEHARQAEEQARRARIAQKFVASLFSLADPQEARVEVDFAKPLLERGLKTAARELGDDPQTHALVVGQIGDIYGRLGLNAENLAAQTQRVALVKANSARDPDAWVDAQLAVGEALDLSSEATVRDQSLAWFTQALESAQHPDASANRRVLALAYLADHHRSRRQLPLARDYARRAIALARSTLADPSADLAVAWATQAVVLRDLGQTDEAREAFAQALRIDETGLGRTRHERFQTQIQLAQLAHDMGRYAEAVAQALSALQFADTKLGDLGAQLAPPRRIVVFAAERMGDWGLAQRYADSLLQAELMSGSDLRVGAARAALARVHLSANRTADAQAALQQAQATIGSHATWGLRLAAFQTELFLRLGRSQDAATYMGLELKRLRQTLAPQHPELGSLLEVLGIAQARLGRWADADATFSEACAIRALTRKPHHPQRVRCQAYALLTDVRLDAEGRHQALARLNAEFVRAHDHPTGLQTSLRALIAFERRASAHLANPNSFPILN